MQSRCVNYAAHPGSHSSHALDAKTCTQVHRIAHHLWNTDQRLMARALQSRVSQVFAIDIHPAARIGAGLLLDHGSGVVIGETAVVGNNVSMMQGVTLGGGTS